MSDTENIDLPKSDQFADFEADFPSNNDNFGTFEDFPNDNISNKDDDFADFAEDSTIKNDNFGDFDTEFPENNNNNAVLDQDNEFDAFGSSSAYENDQSFGNFDDAPVVTVPVPEEDLANKINIPTLEELQSELKKLNYSNLKHVTLEQIKSKNDIHKKMVDYINDCTKNGDVDGLNDKLFINEDNYLCSLNSALMCTSNQPVFDFKYERTRACKKYKEVREVVLNQE